MNGVKTMLKKGTVLIFGLCVLLAACDAKNTNTQQPETGAEEQIATLAFYPTFNGEALIFNEFAYPAFGGEGRFQIRDFQLFISNIRFTGSGGIHAIEDSYHLIQFDNPDRKAIVKLSGVHIGHYDSVAFAIGVDERANHSLDFRGDLNPNGRMAWNWEAGYKFVLLEGMLQIEQGLKPLVYHIGFSENLKTVRFDLKRLENQDLPLEIDIAKLFDSTHSFNMLKTPSVKFHKADASLLADNYANMIVANW